MPSIRESMQMPRNHMLLAVVVLAGLQCESVWAGSGNRVAPETIGSSFNCARATATIERLICSDPALSANDSYVLKLYTRLRAALPRRYREKVLNEQREWLRRRDSGCGVSENVAIGDEDRPTYLKCLTGAYNERIGSLAFELAVAGKPDPNELDHLAAPTYEDKAWKVVDAAYASSITAMTVEEARNSYGGKQQYFYKGRAEGPFLNCQAFGRQVDTRYLKDAEAIVDNDLKTTWLTNGVKLNGNGLFVVSMKCGTPGTKTYGGIEFLQIADNQMAYFIRDGIMFRAIPAN